MEVNGVRNSCVIESSRADLSRSLSREASLRIKCVNSAGALNGNRNQPAHRFQCFPGKRVASDSQTSQPPQTHADGNQRTLVFTIKNRFAGGRDALKLCAR